MRAMPHSQIVIVERSTLLYGADVEHCHTTCRWHSAASGSPVGCCQSVWQASEQMKELEIGAKEPAKQASDETQDRKDCPAMHRQSGTSLQAQILLGSARPERCGVE